jgi:hypothetical protein
MTRNWKNPTHSVTKTIGKTDEDICITTVEEFFRGDSVSTYRNIPLVKSANLQKSVDSLWAIRNNRLYFIDFFDSDTDFYTKLIRGIEGIDDNVFDGQIVKYNDKIALMINGDPLNRDEPQRHCPLAKIDCFTVSFECLRRLKINPYVMNVIDYVDDQIIKKPKTAKVPAGYTWTGTRWHRSASVVVSYDYGCFLLGQDEGSYFGCQLPKMAKSLNDAYEILIPDEVKGKRFIRQGEWFAIPVSENKVPKIKNCVVTGYSVILPRKSADSNPHLLVAHDWVAERVINSGIENSWNIRVTGDGKIFGLDCEILHRDHEAIENAGWHQYVENTAIQSVSVEGVD